jgi:ubiquinone/menaquinone biosynthesis C-methylase UbiE
MSDALIAKARERGIAPERLRVCDATATGYPDGSFDYSYSIGSLEHFSEAGIARMLAEAARITRRASFHHVPTARDGRDHGWITPYQSYFNNSVAWWLPRFRSAFPIVEVVESTWRDEESRGMWFLCAKQAE